MANKKDLVDSVQKELEISGNRANQIVNVVLSNIQDLAVKDGHLGLAKFGVFEIRERAERKGRNLQTGETMTIPASKIPVFHAAKDFKEVVKEGK